MNNNEPNKSEVGKRIRSIRTKKGLTLEEFGLIFDPPASKSIVSRWESGKSVPSPERIKTITEHFNISTMYLLYGKITFDDARYSSEYEKFIEKPDFNTKEAEEKINSLVHNSNLEDIRFFFSEFDLSDLNLQQGFYLLEVLAPLGLNDAEKYDDELLSLLVKLLSNIEHLYRYSEYKKLIALMNQSPKSKTELKSDIHKHIEEIIKFIT
ncbi:helix-turn-helix domain-containing protein [Enterococcus diestrammenae]|uniref:helix-turn-helix domain-containing protein n=1 Tax=Enterococcus diestrammenae TaxID=1155073 RepID=UPI00195E08E6